MSHYWPMYDFSDVVGGAHLIGGVNYSLTSDRFYRQSQAFNLKNGYLNTPSGLNTNGDATLTYWILIQTYGSFAGFRSFVNTHVSSSKSHLGGFYTEDGFINVVGPAIQLNEWTYVAITLNGNFVSLYLNGIIVASNSTVVQNASYGDSKLARAIFDEVKLYQGAMIDSEIFMEYTTVPCES